MKTKKFAVEIRKETSLKSCPVRWDIFLTRDGKIKHSRNDCRALIKAMRLPRGNARITKLEN
jgi:hypothetical protein